MLCRVRIKISAMIFEVEGRKMEKNWPIKTDMSGDFNPLRRGQGAGFFLASPFSICPKIPTIRNIRECNIHLNPCVTGPIPVLATTPFRPCEQSHGFFRIFPTDFHLKSSP